MSQRAEEPQDRTHRLDVTDFERERLDWQRRLYAAEELAARLLTERNQVERSLQTRIAELESEVVRLRQRLEEQRRIAVAQGEASRASANSRPGAHDDPFGHVIRQAHKGKHARVRRKVRQHLLFLVLVGLVLALAAMLIWQGIKSRPAAKSTVVVGLRLATRQNSAD